MGLADSGESHGAGGDLAAPALHRQAPALLLQNAGTGHPKLRLRLGPPTLGGASAPRSGQSLRGGQVCVAGLRTARSSAGFSGHLPIWKDNK